MYCHNMQNNITDCGMAVLKTVLQQFNRNLPRNFIDVISVEEGQGLSLNDLKNVLCLQGIQAAAYEVTDLNELKNVILPSIAIINQNGINHYVVVHSYNDKNGEVILSDPAKIEITSQDIKEFEKLFSGYMLCIEKVEKKVKREKESGLYNDVMKEVSVRTKLKYSLVSIIKWGIPIVLFFFVQYLFMFHIEKMNSFNILLVVILFCFLSFGYYYLSLIYQEYRTSLEKSISIKMTMRYLMNEIKNVNGEKNANSTEGIFWNIIISVLGILQKFYLKIDLLLIAIFIGMLAILNWVYAVLALIFVLAICIYGYTIKDLIKNRQVELIRASGEMSACIQEMTQSSLDLKIFTNNERVEKYCNHIYDKYENVRESIGQEDMRMTAFYDMCSYVTMAIGLAVIFVSYNVNMEFSSSSLIMAFYMTIFMTMNFKPTFQRWIQYQKSINAIEYIEFVVKFHEEEKKEIRLNYEQINKIELEQIKVKLSEKVILDNLDFQIERGMIVGIEGENGSGKSTLAKTILGLIDPVKGKIKINGKELNISLSNSDIAKYASFYSSELYVYSNSVKNNISFDVFSDGERNATYSYMNDLAPDYLMFMNGINISQGERQKILLDRCFEKEKSIYIFDEPGINLDQKSIDKMVKKFKELKEKGKLVLIISHEKNILSCCDKCYEMNRGQMYKIGE